MHNNIYNKILGMFPNINWKSLNKTTYPHIRFYFDRLKSLNKSKERGNEIISCLATTIILSINPNEKIYFGVTFFKKERVVSNYFLKKLKKLGINFLSKKSDGMKLEENIEKKIIEVEKDVKFTYYFGKSERTDEIYAINKQIVLSDFILKRGNIQIGCYLFFPESEILINVYDDRGMDIISTNSNNLNRIYEKWHKVIDIEFMNNK